MTKKTGSNTALLIIDEMPITRQAIQHYFAKRDFRTYSAEVTEKALSLVKVHSPDIIIIDADSIKINAIELTQAIRWLNMKVKIIILSDSPMDEVEALLLNQLEVFEYITKPVGFPELERVVQQALLQKD